MPTTTRTAWHQQRPTDHVREADYRHVGDQATRTRERCPECGKGYVVHLSDNPTAVRDVCSRRCGWDA